MNPQTLIVRLWRSLGARFPRRRQNQGQGQPAGQPPAHWPGQTQPSDPPAHWLAQIQHFTPYPPESNHPLPVDDKLAETPERPAQGVEKRPQPATPVGHPAQMPRRSLPTPTPLPFTRVQFSGVKAGQQRPDMPPPPPPKPQAALAAHEPQGKPGASPSPAPSPAAWPSGREQLYENPWPEHGRQTSPFIKPLQLSGEKAAHEQPIVTESDRWPTLPHTPPIPADITHVLWVWRHHQRLDQEQRGNGWNG